MRDKVAAVSVVRELAAVPLTASGGMHHTDPFSLTSEGPWIGRGDIKQGRTCNGYYRTRRIAAFRRLYLTVPPAHGTLLLHEGGTYSYTAPVGFTGSDPFMLRVCGKEGLISGCSRIVYNMTVE